MKALVGIAIVCGCVTGGYAISGGHFHVLWQPAEFLIILGASVGAFVVSNSGAVIKATLSSLGELFKGWSYSKKDYIELLSMQWAVFQVARSKGLLVLESHIENPKESQLFQKFPQFLKNHDAVTFLCDYVRLMTMGCENAYQMEDLMNAELDVFEHEALAPGHAMTNMGDGMPALGIVAAVLGVIHTMGSISEPPDVLGHLIGAALVGTFAGVLFAYGFIGPMGSAIQDIGMQKIAYMRCIRSGLIAYLHGHPPIIAMDHARKQVDEHNRPKFTDMEESIQNMGELI